MSVVAMGDVAFLVSELVGPDGKVVGVDMGATALEKARKRAEQLKLRNVEFIHGDIRTTALSGPFGAAVGRLVLLYFADPVAVLARIAAQVRCKGIVAFQEMEMNNAAVEATYGDSLVGSVAVTIYRIGKRLQFPVVERLLVLPNVYIDLGRLLA